MSSNAYMKVLDNKTDVKRYLGDKASSVEKSEMEINKEQTEVIAALERRNQQVDRVATAMLESDRGWREATDDEKRQIRAMYRV